MASADTAWRTTTRNSRLAHWSVHLQPVHLKKPCRGLKTESQSLEPSPRILKHSSATGDNKTAEYLLLMLGLGLRGQLCHGLQPVRLPLRFHDSKLMRAMHMRGDFVFALGRKRNRLLPHGRLSELSLHLHLRCAGLGNLRRDSTSSCLNSWCVRMCVFGVYSLCDEGGTPSQSITTLPNGQISCWLFRWLVNSLAYLLVTRQLEGPPMHRHCE